MIRSVLATLLLPLLVACGGASPVDAGGQGQAEDHGTIILATTTTTSTQDSGLLDDLVPRFTDETGWEVKTIAVGSGQAIELAGRGEADVALVHSPAAEEELMAQGTAGRRLLVMHNDFVLLGPPGDPAAVTDLPVATALARIAEQQVGFVSRGDESGTHTKELGLWADAAAEPEGAWYAATGQGMGATLRIASEKAAYTLSDRATWLSQRDTLDLAVLVEGEPGLLNVYHVIEMAAAGERVEADGATVFADWITSAPVQATIGEFGAREFGEPPFVPDAGKDPDDLAS